MYSNALEFQLVFTRTNLHCHGAGAEDIWTTYDNEERNTAGSTTHFFYTPPSPFPHPVHPFTIKSCTMYASTYRSLMIMLGGMSICLPHFTRKEKIREKVHPRQSTYSIRVNSSSGRAESDMSRTCDSGDRTRHVRSMLYMGSVSYRFVHFSQWAGIPAALLLVERQQVDKTAQNPRPHM